MQTQSRRFLTPEEYLAIERGATGKSEYYAGEMFALAGASPAHNIIAGNIFASLHGQLRGSSCTPYVSDLRVKINALGKYTYPDVVVACDEQLFDDEQCDTLLNPTVIIEVLSEGTEAYDRGRKFEHYRRIDSLRQYLLVSQECRRIEEYFREDDDEWSLSEAFGLGSFVTLPSIGCELVLEDVYDKVDLPVTADDLLGL